MKNPISKKTSNVNNDEPTVQKDKYVKLINKKRKLDDVSESTPVESSEQAKVKDSKKPRLAVENNGKQKVFSNKKTEFNKKSSTKKFLDGKNGTNGKSKPGNKNLNTTKPVEKLSPAEKKELRQKRRQKKLGEENYGVTINIKKIWETLRRAETTDDTKKKLCSSLYENVKGKISEMAMAHDTCRVIECLVQYGNENHRNGVFSELKDNLVELSKSKYARFMIKKLLSYCDKDQKEIVIRAFIGRATKLIKHSFACQIIETIFNEYASFSQRNQMLMEFYDPTFALINDKKFKSLSDIIQEQPFSKEKILANLREILISCINKTLLMFSIIHRVFLEYFQNCDQNQRTEMIDLIAEHLVHMVHTKDGAQVAMQCIWHGTAKDRKKIIKAMKSFFLKISLEEQGHLVLLAIFDSVDDTKFVSKSVLEELFRSIKELFENEYGRKVITYLITPRDSKFFLKDYVKRLEVGDSTDTSKKDSEVRRKELFEYSKAHLKTFLSKEMPDLLYNGAGGILIPLIIEKLGSDGNELIQKIASLLLQKRYEVDETLKTSNDKSKESSKPEEKQHYIEDATCHYILKKILEIDPEREKNSYETLTQSLISHQNSVYMRGWIKCNRGCFALVKIFEVGNNQTKKSIKVILGDSVKELQKDASSGAQILLKKLNEI